MKVKFWGVRGSIPVPGPKTVRYGGNTTCIEVRTSDNHLIILDAGTGIYPLSMSLFPEFPMETHIFNTHTHWDHIHGLPFFIPLFVPGNEVHIYGAFDPIGGRPIDDILTTQLQYRHFPVREVELKAKVDFRTLKESESVQIGAATITPVMMNHPVINFGYRIDDHGKSMFFTGDHEAPYNIYAPEDDEYAIYEEILEKRNQHIRDAIAGVDFSVQDSASTEMEYPQKKGWGHGTLDRGIRLGEEIGAAMICLTHHEPTRSDDDLEKVFAEALDRRKPLENEPNIILACEGLTLQL